MFGLLQDSLASQTAQVKQILVQYFDQKRMEADHYSPHLVRSIEQLEKFSLRGGKMIRSNLVVLAYHLAGGKSQEIYRVAAGIELFHKHLLNLDDMADRDELRYGGPTVWKAYEALLKEWPDVQHHARTLSEIDGTLLGSLAFELVRTAQFPPAVTLEIMGTMHQIMYWDTVAGWQIQYMMNQSPVAEADEQLFMKGLELVTGQYTFVAPLKIGILAAGGSMTSPLALTLEKYGRAVGRAFQVQDDILGVFGDPAETGKPVGNDVREGKKSLLMIEAYRQASPAERKRPSQLIGTPLKASDLEWVQDLVQKTGSLVYSRKVAQQSVSEGVVALDEFGQLHPEKDTEIFAILRQLAQFVVERKV